MVTGLGALGWGLEEFNGCVISTKCDRPMPSALQALRVAMTLGAGFFWLFMVPPGFRQ